MRRRLDKTRECARMAEASDLCTTGGRRREYRDHRLAWVVRSDGIEVVLAGLRDRTIRFSWPGTA